MARQTVASVASEVLKAAGHPMTAQQIYDEIAAEGLYQFKTQSPLGIVRSALSKHSVQNTHACASKNKKFNQLPDGRYENLS